MPFTSRSFDGSGNNLAHPTWGQAGTDFVRFTHAHFADGVSIPETGPNARMISNVVVGQGDAHAENPQGLSGFMYAWGQFIDHDLDLNRSDGKNHIDILVPAGDQNFVPGSFLPMTRGVVDPATGAGTGVPAAAVNSITSWIDGSQVYGSSKAVADSLRLPDGHMRTSAGDNLPIVNGQFAAGDVRASENSALTAIQDLFVREHNFWVDQLKTNHPAWTGDNLYLHARAIVGAEIERVTYEEFLPALLGKNALDKYHGYDSHVDARISVEFAGAAFRLGHSLVSDDITAIDELGGVTFTRDLKDDFGSPPSEFPGTDGLLRNLASEDSQALDARIVDDLRSFLFDPNGPLDLAAINIQRGRDLGLGTLNEVRADLHLKPYTSFEQISADAATVAALKEAYGGHVDDVDLWVGGISERASKGAMVGETFGKIIATQFENLRDGDRFWFENPGGQFTKAEIKEIRDTSLGDIILRNTDTKTIQDNVFVAVERGDLGDLKPKDLANLHHDFDLFA